MGRQYLLHMAGKVKNIPQILAVNSLPKPTVESLASERTFSITPLSGTTKALASDSADSAMLYCPIKFLVTGHLLFSCDLIPFLLNNS